MKFRNEEYDKKIKQYQANQQKIPDFIRSKYLLFQNQKTQLTYAIENEQVTLEYVFYSLFALLFLIFLTLFLTRDQ